MYTRNPSLQKRVRKYFNYRRNIAHFKCDFILTIFAFWDRESHCKLYKNISCINVNICIYMYIQIQCKLKFINNIDITVFEFEMTLMLNKSEEKIALEFQLYLSLKRKISGFCSTFEDRKMFTNRRFLWILGFCK